jgi:chemotaxis receptor (MCP) glutamine deamidase CheD
MDAFKAALQLVAESMLAAEVRRVVLEAKDGKVTVPEFEREIKRVEKGSMDL